MKKLVVSCLDKLKKILKCPSLYYGVFFCLMILLFYFDLVNKLKLHNVVDSRFNYVFIAIASIGAILIIAITIFIDKLHKKGKLKAHILFIIVGLSLGFAQLVLSPPLTGSDEQIHFYRIYEITQGKMITPVSEEGVGSYMPSSLAKVFLKPSPDIKYTDITEMLSVQLEKDKVESYANRYSGAALYSPLQYIPHIIGAGIGNILNLPPYFIVMLGRIVNLLSYIAIGAIGIMLLPKLKTFATILLLSPAILATAVTLSTDGFTVSIIFLFIAYILNIMYTKRKLLKRDYAIIGILSILVAICKIVYLPIIGIVFFLPKESFESKKIKNIFTIVVLALGIALSLSWFKVTGTYFDNYYTQTEAQIHWVFSNIIEYIIIIIRTYAEYIIYLVTNIFVGNEMYSAQLDFYDIIPILFLILSIFSAINEDSEKEKKVTVIQKITVLGILICVIGLLSTALYIQCTAQFVAIANPLIIGLQGRYFVPIALLLLFVLGGNKKIVKDYTLVKLLLVISFPVYLTMMIRFLL